MWIEARCPKCIKGKGLSCLRAWSGVDVLVNIGLNTILNEGKQQTEKEKHTMESEK